MTSCSSKGEDHLTASCAVLSHDQVLSNGSFFKTKINVQKIFGKEQEMFPESLIYYNLNRVSRATCKPEYATNLKSHKTNYIIQMI